MINKFSIENFKVFNEKTEFEFAPITILTGPNNSGKSSLTKSVAALLNSQKDDVFKGIDLHSPIIPLGDFKSIKNRENPDSHIKMTLQLSDNDPWEFRFYYCCSYRVPFWGDITELDIYAELDKLEITQEGMVLLEFENTIGDGRLFYTNINFDNSLEYFRKKGCPNANKLYKLIQKHEIKIKLPGCEFDRTKTKGFVTHFTDRVIEHLLSYDPEPKSKKVKCEIDKTVFSQFVEPYQNKINNQKDYDQIISSMEKLYRKTMKIAGKCIEDIRYNANELRYLPINRGSTKRNFNFNSDETLIERIIYYLSISSASENCKLNISEIFNGTKNKFNEKWLDYFLIGKEIIIKQTDSPNYNIFIKNYKDELTPIFDVGHGLAGLITLLFGLRELEFGGFCIIEEPETNLHPAFQSKLADLFTAVTKKIKHQLLIETHSEYLIRKFQYLVAQGEMKPEEIVIYYFNDPSNIPEGEEHVKKIMIEKDGSLSDNFGAGFFDEATNLKFDLLKQKRPNNN